MYIYWPDYVNSSCRQNHTYFDSSDFMIAAYHFTALFTIPLSIFTFYTIIRVTPEKMKNMKIPLLIAHAWGTNLDLMLTVNMTPLMYYPTASGTPRGLFGALGAPAKWSAYFAQVSIFMAGANFVMLLENRHSQISWIKFKITRLKTRISYFGVNYFSAFFLMLAFYLEGADQMELRKFVLKFSIPWTVLAGPVCYSLYADANNYYNQAFNNFSMLFMALHGLLSNSCTLFIVKPYRDFVQNLITGNSEFNSSEIGVITNAAPVSVRLASTPG